MRRQTADGGRRSTGLVLLAGAAIAWGCGERRDVAELAAGVAPFNALRGVNAVALRSGGVRAFRAAAVPAAGAGLRETIAGFEVVYVIPGFEGDSGGWPSEDALVYVIEATHEWDSDSAAHAAVLGALRHLRDRLGMPSRCWGPPGPDHAMTLAEWDLGGGWALTVSYGPAISDVTGARLPARHAIAVRREALPDSSTTTCEAPIL